MDPIDSGRDPVGEQPSALVLAAIRMAVAVLESRGARDIEVVAYRAANDGGKAGRRRTPDSPEAPL